MALEADPLGAPDAHARAVRGGALRTFGYAAGLVLTLASAPLLIRHLGVVGYGQYVTASSLITIVALFADAGLTTVGVREYAIRDPGGRTELMRNLVAARMIVTVVGVAAALGFALVADYPAALVAGVGLAGVGLIFTMIQQTCTIPLMADLRLGLATGLDLLRQALTALGVVALVIVGGGVVSFLALRIPVALLVLAFTVVLIGSVGRLLPHLEAGEWRYLLRETVPAAAASALASVFYRVGILIMSITATARETGYFSASFRVVEVLIVLPSLIVGAAYPVLVRAHATDRLRLIATLDRLFQVSVVLGGWIGMSVVLGAGPAIDFIAGREFGDSVPVLRIQGLALAVSFLVGLWGGTLWIVRAKGTLVAANAVGVVCAAVLVTILAPVHGAEGTAVAMVISEVVLAVCLGSGLMYRHPDLRPRLAVVAKTLAAVAAGGSLWLTGLPEGLVTVLASSVYFGLLATLRGIPEELGAPVRSVRKRIRSRRSGSA